MGFFLPFIAPVAVTEVFEYTGSAQTTTVPAWANFVTVDLIGGGGANKAGRLEGKLAVAPSASIQVNVGGTSLPFNGGGGSGGTDIRIGGTALADRKMIAGGSGDDGLDSIFGPSVGGLGGGTTADDGDGRGGGTGGSQVAGGTAPGCPAGDGSLGQGGGTACGGSGGGGGYYGGGGGVYGESAEDPANDNYQGAGGGGSSYADGAATAVVHTQGYASAPTHGRATLTWSAT